jgi:L-rhamnose 1-dehydrogenase
MRFKDKVVIVTGAARGIGRAIAEGFAREGARVVIADILREEGEGTAARLAELGGQGLFIQTDTSRKADVDAMVQRTVDEFGRIDVLVNDAGICPFEDFLTMSEELWDRVLDVNLKGYFLCSQAVARVMVAKGIRGRIVHVSSISAIVGGAQQAHYCASKAGINLLSASMAIALGPYGITSNCVLPGPILTDINREDLSNPEKVAYFQKRTPIKGIGDPQDVVGPVLFYASDEAAYCTGSTLVVDGGILVNFQ